MSKESLPSGSDEKFVAGTNEYSNLSDSKLEKDVDRAHAMAIEEDHVRDVVKGYEDSAGKWHAKAEVTQDPVLKRAFEGTAESEALRADVNRRAVDRRAEEAGAKHDREEAA